MVAGAKNGQHLGVGRRQRTAPFLFGLAVLLFLGDLALRVIRTLGGLIIALALTLATLAGLPLLLRLELALSVWVTALLTVAGWLLPRLHDPTMSRYVAFTVPARMARASRAAAEAWFGAGAAGHVTSRR